MPPDELSAAEAADVLDRAERGVSEDDVDVDDLARLNPQLDGDGGDDEDGRHISPAAAMTSGQVVVADFDVRAAIREQLAIFRSPAALSIRDLDADAAAPPSG